MVGVLRKNTLKSGIALWFQLLLTQLLSVARCPLPSVQSEGLALLVLVVVVGMSQIEPK